MKLLDEIQAAVAKLSEQPVSIDDAEQVGQQAKQAAKALYRFMDTCFAMCLVDEEELDLAIRDVGAMRLIDEGVLRVVGPKWIRWKGKA
jgi:hypothetical protein